MIKSRSITPFLGPVPKMSKIEIILFKSLENRYSSPKMVVDDEILVKFPLNGPSTKMSKMKILLSESLENRYLGPLGSVDDETLVKFPLNWSSTKNE